MKSLDIGDRVEVFAQVQAGYRGNRRKLFRDRVDPWFGVIVGATRRNVGIYYKGYGYGDDSKPPYLSVDRRIFVYKVSRGLTRRPVEVLPYDLRAV